MSVFTQVLVACVCRSDPLDSVQFYRGYMFTWMFVRLYSSLLFKLSINKHWGGWKISFSGTEMLFLMWSAALFPQRWIGWFHGAGQPVSSGQFWLRFVSKRLPPVRIVIWFWFDLCFHTQVILPYLQFHLLPDSANQSPGLWKQFPVISQLPGLRHR